MNTAHQLLASRDNLQTALTRRERKTLHIEIYGSCVRCRYDTVELNPERCKRCINGGGKDNLFEPKPRKTGGKNARNK